MTYNRFDAILYLRLSILFLTLVIAAWLLANSHFYAVCMVLFAAILIQAIGICRHTTRTNVALSRFLDAMHHADYTQAFLDRYTDSGFGRLNQSFSNVLNRFQSLQHQKEKNIIYLRGLVDHIPVPLISLYEDGTITTHNRSARRLFGSTTVSHTEHLKLFGSSFKNSLLNLQPGENKLVEFCHQQEKKTLAIKTTQLTTPQRFSTTTHGFETLVSLLDVKTELEETQVRAWQDLVSVLTHEIMNSLTPISSLASSTMELLNDLLHEKAGNHQQRLELHDIYSGVSIMARRSDGLMAFVQNYRRLTRLPSPKKSMIRIMDILTHTLELMAVKWMDKKLSYTIETISNEIQIYADPEMLEQILINLLKNAEQALADTPNPKVHISVRLSERGSVIVDIADNGRGIADDIATKIFVPFFTTKKNGSGIGLALTQQIMLAHGGSIIHMRNTEGGATFSLMF